MKKSLLKRKRFLGIGLIVAALWAGALVRASHHGSILSGEAPPQGTIRRTDASFTPKDHNLPAGTELLGPDLGASSDERGGMKGSDLRPGPGVSSGKNSSKPDEPADLKEMKKGIHPINRPPGDMKEYLDEAEKARRERISKSLKEVRRKVKEWQRSIFEPTW